MSDVFYLAWRYLTYHRFKTITLVGSITLIAYLPWGLNILVNQSARQLRERTASTPLLVGAKGSPLDLVLNSLYYDVEVPPAMRYAESQRVVDSGLAEAIPLQTRFRTQHGPIVGTSLEYFAFRELSLERGRLFGLLGECVLGARLAREAGLGPDDALLSAPEGVFDIAGAYPLKMKVVGVLAANGTPDDRAVFVDLKTTWVIAGLAHGHQDLSSAEAESGVLRREGSEIIANASVMQYNEITSENVASFHFHGDPGEFPVTAVIALPHDQKAGTLLRGRYLGDDQVVQIVQPAMVMEGLLRTIFTVRLYLLIAVAVVGLATLASMTLVFLLSLQLRRRERETMIKLGGSRRRIAALMVTEVVSVVAIGGCCAALLAMATAWAAEFATRVLIRLV